MAQAAQGKFRGFKIRGIRQNRTIVAVSVFGALPIVLSSEAFFPSLKDIW